MAQEQPKSLLGAQPANYSRLKQGGAIGRVEPHIILIELAAALGVIATALTDDQSLKSWPSPDLIRGSVPAIGRGTNAGRDGRDTPGHDGEKAV
jgi:hypothetical protein